MQLENDWLLEHKMENLHLTYKRFDSTYTNIHFIKQESRIYLKVIDFHLKAEEKSQCASSTGLFTIMSSEID